mgnify:CR=1 FL=1
MLARDEEANLPRCLDALPGCDDIVVVDDMSADATCEVARSRGARFVQRRFDTFAGKRNWALDTVEFKHEWVLHLDADEVVTPALLAEIDAAIASTDCIAFRIPSKMMFLGRWLRHAATYPAYQVRLGRNPGLRFVQVGHGQREDLDSAQVGTLTEPYLHFAFSKGLEAWFAKHNRYSTLEAEEAMKHLRGGGVDWAGLAAVGDPVRRRRALKELSFRLPCRPALRFLYMYVLRRGFLDGKPGLMYCRMMATYERMIVWKMREIRLRERGEPV